MVTLHQSLYSGLLIYLTFNSCYFDLKYLFKMRSLKDWMPVSLKSQTTHGVEVDQVLSKCLYFSAPRTFLRDKVGRAFLFIFIFYVIFIVSLAPFTMGIIGDLFAILHKGWGNVFPNEKCFCPFLLVDLWSIITP